MRRLLLVLPLLLLTLPACDSSESDDVEITIAAANSFVVVSYVGSLEDGTVFDQSNSAAVELARTIPGSRDGVVGMEVGETKTIVVPPEQGHGANPVRDSQNNGLIPANSTLTFVVTLLDIIE